MIFPISTILLHNIPLWFLSRCQQNSEESTTRGNNRFLSVRESGRWVSKDVLSSSWSTQQREEDQGEDRPRIMRCSRTILQPFRSSHQLHRRWRSCGHPSARRSRKSHRVAGVITTTVLPYCYHSDSRATDIDTVPIFNIILTLSIANTRDISRLFFEEDRRR